MSKELEKRMGETVGRCVAPQYPRVWAKGVLTFLSFASLVALRPHPVLRGFFGVDESRWRALTARRS